MDSRDIYNSENNSNINDNNNSTWIDNAVLVDSDNIVWHENGPEITVDYSEMSEQTLTENEGYVTADTDGDETSEYFSILSTNCTNTETEICNFNSSKYEIGDINSECVVNVEVAREEIILPDLTKADNTNEDDDESNNVDQVMLYRMEGSNELYAEQVADDGSGHFQTYRYKVRQTADGQFEAVAGSIEIHNVYAEDSIRDNRKESMQNIKQEKSSWDCLDQSAESDSRIPSTESINENIKFSGIKTTYSTEANEFTKFSPNYLLQSANETGYDDEENEESDDYDAASKIGIASEANTYTEISSDKEICGLSSAESGNSESEYEIEELEEDFQDDYIFKDETYDTNIPEILHGTFKMKCADVSFPQNKALKQVTDHTNVNVVKNNKQRVPYIVNTKEKENISVAHSVDNNIPVHFKSILKNNCASSNVNCSRQKTISDRETSNLLLNNDLNLKDLNATEEVKDTNTVAVKSTRQPRKQIITPVERAGSEIIVLPLIYPLVDTIPETVSSSIAARRRRMTNEIYQVSDESDPEFTLKPIKRKKLKRGRYSNRSSKQVKPIEITISDTDEDPYSDKCVIDLLSDQENSLDAEDGANFSSNKELSNETSKTNIVSEVNGNRYQGHTKKETSVNNNVLLNNKDFKSTLTCFENFDETNNDAIKTVPLTVTKIEAENKKKTVRKNNIKCPMCHKTFPRQANLKSHMNIHNARRVLRSKIMTRNKTSVSDRPNSALNEIKNDTAAKGTNVRKTDAYSCEKCQLKFFTEVQFNRHQTVHKKQIPTVDHRNIYQRNNNFVKNNVKQKTKISTRNTQSNSIKLPKMKTVHLKQSSKSNLKCEYCAELFSDQDTLDCHRNAHKTFPCPTCKTTFTAKLLLDTHLRMRCFKNTYSKSKVIQRNNLVNMTSLTCSLCKKMFSTIETLKKHTLNAHNMETITGNTRRILHTGVPTSSKLRNAFVKINQKT